MDSKSPVVLRLPELLAAVFAWLPKGDLTSVARVCRFWTPCALDMIWQTIPDFETLMDLFQIIMWNNGTGAQEDTSDDDPWEVFWAYCLRVHTIERCLEAYDPGVTDNLIFRVEKHLRGPSLLPNLRSITLRSWADEPHIVEILPIIPTRLRALSLYAFRDSAAFQRLLGHLAAIPISRLSTANFHVSGDNVTVTRLLQLNLATLVDLTLAGPHLTASTLKRLGSVPGVTRLTIQPWGAKTGLDEFFASIGSSFPRLSFLCVTLDQAIEEDVPVTVLEGLAECRELQTVYMRSPKWKTLSGEDARRVGSWWPLMELFFLSQNCHPDQVTTPLGILEEFARVWSATLLDIGLEFDATTPLPSPASVRFRIDDVAEFLKTVSPGRLKIDSDGFRTKYEDDSLRWDVVMKKVEA
ncbi:hypothetical protein FRC01_004035, partial [Tulasnella sp. 417]